MKLKITSTLIIVFMLTIFTLPVLANSNNWGFTLNYRLCDGSANGVFHSMSAGNMTLNGDIWAYSKDSGATSNPNTVYIRIYESVPGVDRSVGTISATPSTTLYTEVPVYGTYGSQNAGSYYLYIFKTEDDNWNIEGSGTLNT